MTINLLNQRIHWHSKPNSKIKKNESTWFSFRNYVDALFLVIYCDTEFASYIFICICISLTYCFQFVNLPILAAWLMFHFATRTEHLYAALCLAGLGGGLMEAPVSDPWSKYLHKIEMRPTIVACPYDDLAEMVVYSMYWTQPFNWFNRF